MSGAAASMAPLREGVPEVGVVVVGHGGFAAEMVQTLLTVVGGLNGVEGVACRLDAPREAICAAVCQALDQVDRGAGAIIFTDMLGDTASNVSLEVARNRPDVEVVCGVNMPMLMKLATARRGSSASELAGFIRRYGQEHICWPTGDGCA